MDWRSYAILLFCFYFLYLPLVAKTHLLPEDLISDDAEQLEREKRDGFFERIFSFFNNKHEKEEEELEKEEDESQNEKVQDVLKDDDITASFRGYSLPEINLPFTDSSTRETLFTDSTWEAKPTSYTSTLQNTKIFTESTQVGSSSSMSLPTLKLSTAKTPKTIQMLNSVQATPYIASSTEVMTHTKIPEPTSSQFIRSSIKISPTPSRTIEISTTSMAELPAFVDMNVVLADGPRIPDERAYGDVFAQAPQENTVEKSTQAKSVQFLFSNLLIPVVSGLFGAFCFSIAILIMRCIKRRNLRKVNYYGGKPETRLYGLDHMGLLSDMSSDEE